MLCLFFSRKLPGSESSIRASEENGGVAISPCTADVFAYREIDGLGTSEICERLGITSSNFWVILYRARMLLRHCLEMAQDILDLDNPIGV